MRKILFITTPKIKGITGGTICSDRNLRSLKEVFGENNVDVYNVNHYSINRFINSFLVYYNIIKGYLSGLTCSHLKCIEEIIGKIGYSDVFIDNSRYGIIAKHLKNKYPNLKIHTFFHNVEYDFMKSSYKKKRLRYKYILYKTFINEKWSCEYSNTIICLSHRDDLLLQKYYKRRADLQIPITIIDRYTENVPSIPNTKRKGLFLGSYFFGNVDGLIWFCNKVLPILDIELTIIGTNMENIKKVIKLDENIHVYSNVQDLRPFFEEADFMILPIVSGGGMKVKTAEALMYGKYILGSSESLIGYEVEKNVACICDTPDDYVNAIISLKIENKFNQPSRDLYLKKYSFDASLKLFYSLYK